MNLKRNFKFEGKRKDTSLVITRSFQYFFEHRHQLYSQVSGLKYHTKVKF